MEKPKAPQPRKGDEINTEIYRELLSIQDWTCNEIVVSQTFDAEMLIYALSEWISYKHRLEDWKREHVL